MWLQSNKIPKDVYVAIMNLKRNAQFCEFVKWLQDGQVEENRDWPLEYDDIKLRVSQGRAQVINAILNAVENAEETVLKLK